MQPNYSPSADPISRLAAVGAPTSFAMTAGFLVFATGVLLYSRELRLALPGPAALAAAVSGVASVGIAATPLGSALGDTLHAICAGIAYVAIAITPILGGRSLGHKGRRQAAAVSIAIGLASTVSLAASILASPWAGVLQRLGLTLGDAWIIATAWHLLPRSKRTSSRCTMENAISGIACSLTAEESSNKQSVNYSENGGYSSVTETNA